MHYPAVPARIAAAVARNASLRPLGAGLAAAALVLSACGGDDSDAAGTNQEAPSGNASPSDAATDPGSGPDNLGASSDGTTAVEVPDPCSLVPAADLSGILGSDPGPGTLNAVVPEERKVCRYESGLVLAVEIADHYDASVGLMRTGGEVQDVAGVGKAAVWQEVGQGMGQFVALGDEYFVGVTLVDDNGQPEGEAIATAMLDAL